MVTLGWRKVIVIYLEDSVPIGNFPTKTLATKNLFLSLKKELIPINSLKFLWKMDNFMDILEENKN